MTVTSYVLLALGAALTAFATWERLGRSHNARAWLKSPGPRAVRNHLFVYPPLGMLLLVFGAFPLIHDASWIAIPLALVALVALVVLFWFGILAFPCPTALVPPWARDRVTRRPQDA